MEKDSVSYHCGPHMNRILYYISLLNMKLKLWIMLT